MTLGNSCERVIQRPQRGSLHPNAVRWLEGAPVGANEDKHSSLASLKLNRMVWSSSPQVLCMKVLFPKVGGRRERWEMLRRWSLWKLEGYGVMPLEGVGGPWSLSSLSHHSLTHQARGSLILPCACAMKYSLTTDPKQQSPVDHGLAPLKLWAKVTLFSLEADTLGMSSQWWKVSLCPKADGIQVK